MFSKRLILVSIFAIYTNIFEYTTAAIQSDESSGPSASQPSAWIDCPITASQTNTTCQCAPNLFGTGLAATIKGIQWQCSKVRAEDGDNNRYQISGGDQLVKSFFVSAQPGYCESDNMIVIGAQAVLNADGGYLILNCAPVVQRTPDGKEYPVRFRNDNRPTGSKCEWIEWKQQLIGGRQTLQCPAGSFIRGARKQPFTSFYCCPAEVNNNNKPGRGRLRSESLPGTVETVSQLKERGGVVQIGIRGSGDRVLDLQNSTDIRLKDCHELSSDGTKSKWAVDMECLTTADQCSALIVPDRILLLPDQCGGRPARIERLSLTNGMQVIADDGFQLAKPDETVEFVVDYSNQDSFFDPRYGLSLFTRDMKGRNPHDGALHPDTLRKRGLASGEMWKAFSDWAKDAVKVDISGASETFQVKHSFDTVTLFETSGQAHCPLTGGMMAAQAYAQCTLDFTVSADLQFGIKVVGTLLPPAVQEAYVYVKAGLETVSTFRLDAAFSAQLDLVKQLAQVTISPLQIKGVVEIGPSLMLDMAVKGKLSVVSQSEYTTRNRLIDWAVVVGNDADGVMRQLIGSSNRGDGMSEDQAKEKSINLLDSSTQLSLLPASQTTMSTIAAVSGFLMLSLRPKLALGITAVKGVFQATVGVEADASLILSAAGTANAIASFDYTAIDGKAAPMLQYGSEMWVDLSFQAVLMPFAQLGKSQWTSGKLPHLSTGLKSIFRREFSAGGGNGRAGNYNTTSPSNTGPGMLQRPGGDAAIFATNQVRRRSLWKRGESPVKLSCPVGSDDSVGNINSTDITAEDTDPCGGPQKRSSTFACFCLPLPGSIGENSKNANQTLVRRSGSSNYQCLNPAAKYPLARLLREPPPVLFQGSKAKYPSESITEAFTRLYDQVAYWSKGSFGRVYKIRQVGQSQPDRILKAFLETPKDRELEIGSVLTERIIDAGHSDGFVRTLDYFRCDIDMIVKRFNAGGPVIPIRGARWSCLIVEMVHGKTVHDVLGGVAEMMTRNQNVVVELIRSVIFQTLQAVSVAREQVKFGHLDLHVGNVMLDRPDMAANGILDLRVGSQRFRVPISATIGSRIKIIDYGWSGVVLDGNKRLVATERQMEYWNNFGAITDFKLLLKSISQTLGTTVWKSINEVTDYAFNDFYGNGSALSKEPDFYEKLFMHRLFDPYRG